MDIKSRVYPYPVLAEFNDSYKNSVFNVEATIKRDGFDVALDISVKLTDEGLTELIENGQASLVFHLECPKTGYREIKTTDQFNYSIVIEGSKISGELHLCPLIIAAENLTDYYNPNFNNHYNEPVNKIEKGWILAVGRQYNWTITKNTEDMINSSSPFRIIPNVDESQNQMVVEFESTPRIMIKLRKEDYALYKSLKQDSKLKNILNSSIVLPALVYVLEELKKIDSEDLDLLFGNLTWYDAITASLKTNFNKEIKDLEEEDIYILAQKMLKTPINSALGDLADIGNDEDMKGDDDE